MYKFEFGIQSWNQTLFSQAKKFNFFFVVYLHNET